MKITRKQLRRLINETIYVNPQGDAFDTTTDPTGPEMEQFHSLDAKRDFLKAQGNPKLRAQAPNRIQQVYDDKGRPHYDQKTISRLNQGIALADVVGDQGEFKPLEFSEDELELRDFAHDEITKTYDALQDKETYKDNTALQRGTPYFGGETDYSEQFDRIEHQMSLRAKKVLKMFQYPEYFDVIEVLEEVPSYERLMKIIADKEGDFSPNMQKLKKLPEKVANRFGVHF